MLSFAQFGSDLDAATKKILTHGAVLMETLKQKQYNPYPLEMQILELFAVKKGYFDDVKVEQISTKLTELDEFVSSRHKEVLDRFALGTSLSEEENRHVDDVIKEFLAR